jgi:hypothetical protein
MKLMDSHTDLSIVEESNAKSFSVAFIRSNSFKLYKSYVRRVEEAVKYMQFLSVMPRLPRV